MGKGEREGVTLVLDGAQNTPQEADDDGQMFRKWIRMLAVYCEVMTRSNNV